MTPEQHWICLGAFACICLAACKSRPAYVEDYAGACRLDMKDKPVTLRGYISAGGGVTVCSSSCGLQLRTQRDKQYPGVALNVAIGTGRNQMAPLGDKFRESELKITDTNGREVGSLDAVRVSGTLVEAFPTPEGELMCRVKPERIERID